MKNHLVNLAIGSKQKNIEKLGYILISNIGNRGLQIASGSNKKETLWICSVLKEISDTYIGANSDVLSLNVFQFFEGIENNYGASSARGYSGGIGEETAPRLEDDVNIKIVTMVKELIFGSLYAGAKMDSTSIEGVKTLLTIGIRAQSEQLKKTVCENLKVIKDYKNGKEIFNHAFEIFLVFDNESNSRLEPENLRNFMNFCGSKDINLYEDLKLSF